ncbi:MAG TPA: alkaline phosphatase family protein [Streptosporangiaceae bacterium]
MTLVRRASALGAVALAAGTLTASGGTATASTAQATRPQQITQLVSLGNSKTPIKHVIVVIGENHTFDNVYATYTPPFGQRIENLLSEGIVSAKGTPGPHFSKAAQLTASDTGAYTLTPKTTGEYTSLPQPNTTYVPTGCDGLPGNSPDTRFPASLPNGPFQITKYVPYDDSHSEFSGGCQFPGAYVGDPLHRFYQMWQQSAAFHYRLATWVANTAGDDNGSIPPAPIFQGAVQMGFYNMAEGDAPYLKSLAENYAISDNYHQAVQGGTGANHIALGTGYAASYQDAKGNATPPPAGEIENPNAKPGTNNNYTQDGYGSSTVPNTGGSYSECANPTAPGVSTIDAYFKTLPYKPLANCKAGRYYLLNNYNPGYNVDGSLQTAPYTVPPQKTDYVTIGDALSARKVSWAYYGEGYLDNGTVQPQYCGICDPMQYSASIMTNPTLRKNQQHGLTDFLTAAKAGTLSAVSFLKPGDDDSHPGYSSLAAFESFLKNAITAVQSNRKEWLSTAILITWDEGGGYYDSGYIQPVSFFGDGPRVPLIVVSPWVKAGAVDHTYNDHVSILKFIEDNWGLPPLTSYSADNLPNPAPEVYVPRNRPAIGNLMTMFSFGGR